VTKKVAKDHDRKRDKRPPRVFSPEN